MPFSAIPTSQINHINLTFQLLVMQMSKSRCETITMFTLEDVLLTLTNTEVKRPNVT